MSTIKIRGNISDIEIKSITYVNPKIVKQVLLPQGDFLKNEIKETTYYTILKIPGKEVEVEIFGTDKNDEGNSFYKNYNISNNGFDNEENPFTTMSFETNISDIYKIKIITIEKTPGNMINPGKIIQKIYNFDYKFSCNLNLESCESSVSILKTDFSSNINLTENDEEEENNELNKSDEEELEEDESDEEDD
tara:strand:- start:56 stop:631 length:576 start_codon:yes stop_codon:yes gene_type:complete